MYSNGQQNREDNGPPSGRRNLDLWFYERRGSRYYLRVTRLGLILFVLPIVLAIAAIFLLLLAKKGHQIQPDILIKAPTPIATPPPSVLKQATPLAMPPSVNITPPRRVSHVTPTPMPQKNTNE